MDKKLKVLFFVLFLDFLSFSAVITFLPFLFLETPHHCFLVESSIKFRYLVLGALLSTYPMTQIFSAPLLGYVSDKLGRRGILLLSYLGNMVGYFFCSVGIMRLSVEFLFLGYFIAGLMGVNLSMTNAMISDLITEESRPKFFGIPQLVLGIGFVLGSFITRQVLTVADIPFYLFLAGSVISFVNFFLLLCFWDKKEQRRFSVTPMGIKWGDLFSCKRELAIFLLAEFFIFFGWYFFIKTFQIFLVEKLHFNEDQVFSLSIQYGLSIVISQLIFIFYLHRHSQSTRLFYHCIALLAFSIFMLHFSKTYLLTCFVVPLFTFAYTSLMPLLTARIAKHAFATDRGKVMGFHQAIQSIAKIVAPLTGAALLALDFASTALFAPVFICFSWLLFQLQRNEMEKRGRLD